MEVSERLAREACSLGIAVWKAEQSTDYDDEFSNLNSFILRVINYLEGGSVTKEESLVPLLIAQLSGLTNSHALKRLDKFKKTASIARKAIEHVAISPAEKRLFTRILDLAESKYLLDAPESGGFFQIESALVPDYLFEFYEAFIDLEMRRPTSKLPNTEAEK